MNVGEEGGLWKYQLLSRDLTTVINKTSVLLKSDNDYSKMIKMVTMGAQAPLAVLTQVSKTPYCYVHTLTLEQEKLAKPAGPNEHHVQNGGHEAGEQCTTKADRKENVASPAAQEDEGPVWDDNKVINEPLDMDGNPYFEPPTLKGNKRAYEKIGEKLKRYGWDDWPVKDEEEEKMLIDRMVARDMGYEYHG